MKRKLPLINPDVQLLDFQREAEKVYAFVLNGGALPGNKKPGSDEAKIKKDIEIASASGKLIGEALSRIEGPAGENSGVFESAELFYSVCKEVFLVYLDKTLASSISDNDYHLFSKLTKYYESRFTEDMRSLNVLDPNRLTRVTEYGSEIVNFVERIVENNFGYTTPDGSVYFDIDAFKEAGNYYARLEPWNSHDRSLQEEGEGSLSSKHTAVKRSKNDFALWKASQPGEPSWPSPWGKGRPGWHIECSAMASTELGSQMDIHSGGIDLSFPHHDNELAQSEAYWHGDHQWVNYFLHMGHLSIQGAKMSKSLKNFTTIREALARGAWTPRSLRIVFLLGGWREGIEITEDMIKASNTWEEKLNNFFLNAKNFLASREEASSENFGPETDDYLSDCLKLAQGKVYDALCDSFDTSTAMAVISELISNFNSSERSGSNDAAVENIAKWVTSMVNIFGLNGAGTADSSEIGWAGIDIPEYAQPYVDTLSVARDSLRQLATSNTPISRELLDRVFSTSTSANNGQAADISRPYADVLAGFKNSVTTLDLENSKDIRKQLLSLCDRVRDVNLFDLGVYLEDRENKPALVRPVTRELIETRQRQNEQHLRNLQLKEEQRQREHEKSEKAKMSPYEMFKTDEFSSWDEDGVPTKDSSGEDIAKSRYKKLRKDWERQKKLHETWLARVSVNH